MYEWDAFISHASDDKKDFVEPLSIILQKLGLKIWLDKWVIEVGMSLRRTIEKGLANSKYGIVVFSKAFFSKEWPQRELDALSSLEKEPGSRILPIWHNITFDEIKIIAPMFSDRFALQSNSGTEYVANMLFSKIRNADISFDISQRQILSNAARQSIYFVNCSNCSNVLEVINPRLNDTPLVVKGSDTYAFSTPYNVEEIKIGCKICSKHTYVKFIYRDSV